MADIIYFVYLMIHVIFLFLFVVDVRGKPFSYPFCLSYTYYFTLLIMFVFSFLYHSIGNVATTLQKELGLCNLFLSISMGSKMPFL